ncbi:hypothetical protein [Paraflavitalea sp. CAU 1676]|uniref:hypothetical protein n=1 Tax=Paraflavitalea sp. CAU 1676 TaxID=3032598 RepID=UPI0023DA5AD3|nr:hypothetical protein [Paraflavitalea sp. CAU 1676]MDF2188933.1 hypothetical protein [Paraflavitalea sp. CAU 1676]
MRSIRFAFLIIALLSVFNGHSQATPAKQIDFKKAKVSFVTDFNNSNATKDGYYLRGYVVNISPEKGRELDGKKIRVSGKVTVVKGVQNDPNGKDDIQQGRAEDFLYIKKPRIEVLKH